MYWVVAEMDIVVVVVGCDIYISQKAFQFFEKIEFNHKVSLKDKS